MDYENLTPQYRIEEYLEAIVDGWAEATQYPYPDYPSWRLEEFLDAFITYIWEDGDHPRHPCPEPAWRLEECLRAIYDVMTGAATPWAFPTPTNSIEEYLAAIHAYLADGTELPVPEPVWRIEQWLAYVLEGVKQGGDITKTVSGTMVHITDALAKAALSVLVSIEPIQDLHGYSSPWPGGGGKNAMPAGEAGTKESNGIIATSDGHGNYTISGTSSSAADISFDLETGFTIPTSDTHSLFFMNDIGVSGVTFYFRNGSTNIDSFGLSTANRVSPSYVTIGGKVCNRVRFYISANTAIPGTMHLSPMIVTKDVTGNSFIPYSNICPISGRTGLDVYRAGGNLSRCGPASDLTHSSFGITYDWKASTQTWDISGDNESIGQDKMLSIKLSADSDSAIMAGSIIYYYENLPVGCCADMRFRKDGDTYSQQIIGTGEYKATAITVPNDYAHGGCWVRFGTLGTALRVSSTDVHLMISTTQPTQWVKFEEIQKNEIDWSTQAGTVYGGTLDVVTGVLVIKEKYVKLTNVNQLSDFHSSSQYGSYAILSESSTVDRDGQPSTMPIASSMTERVTFENRITDPTKDRCYIQTAGSLTIRARNGISIATVNELFSYFENIEVVYELATPLTYQLSAQEVQMLLGENYVWSSSGDTVSVTYYAEGNANPLQSLNILLGGNYRNPKTADDVSDKEALEIILGGNK